MSMSSGPVLTREQAYLAVGPGWRRLVDAIFDAVEECASPCRIAGLGGEEALLEVVVEPHNPELRQRVGRVQAESLRTCELCAAPGFPGGFAEHLHEKTLCPAHHILRNAGLSFAHLLQLARDPSLTPEELQSRRAEALDALWEEMDRRGALPLRQSTEPG